MRPRPSAYSRSMTPAAVHHPLQMRLEQELRACLLVLARSAAPSARSAPGRTSGNRRSALPRSGRRPRPRTTPARAAGPPGPRRSGGAARPRRKSGWRCAVRRRGPVRSVPDRGGREGRLPTTTARSRRRGSARITRRTRSSRNLCANWSMCVSRRRNQPFLGRQDVVAGDGARAVPARTVVEAGVVAQRVHQPGLPCGAGPDHPECVVGEGLSRLGGVLGEQSADLRLAEIAEPQRSRLDVEGAAPRAPGRWRRSTECGSRARPPRRTE